MKCKIPQIKRIRFTFRREYQRKKYNKQLNYPNRHPLTFLKAYPLLALTLHCQKSIFISCPVTQMEVLDCSHQDQSWGSRDRQKDLKFRFFFIFLIHRFQPSNQKKSSILNHSAITEREKEIKWVLPPRAQATLLLGLELGTRTKEDRAPRLSLLIAHSLPCL